MAVMSGQQPATFALDADGFIRNWLVLAPIAVQEDSGATEIDKEQIDGEAAVRPKAGDALNVGGKIVTWTAHQTADYFIDFRQSFGAERGEDAAGYAVAYVIADEPATLKLSVGSNDQFKLWVNGRQTLKFAETRTLEKDTEFTDVALTKGQNVLVFKVINEKNSWQGCARITTKDGAPAKGIRISLTPQ
jgi:hypothetical protein